MTLSLVLTIHNRTPEVSRQVADSFLLPGNMPDEMVVVLDRPTLEAKTGAVEAYGALCRKLKVALLYIELEGPPGWRSPVLAWNAGFAAATGDYLYCISSETVQEAENISKARTLLGQYPNTVIFGACTNSEPVDLVVGSPPGVLASAALPRPLGFISALPRSIMQAVGGNDPDFQHGLWYEDNDLYIRIWNTGANFLFTDSIHGTHLNHDRPLLYTDEGQAKIKLNASLTSQKYGTLNSWERIQKAVAWGNGITHWRHV